MRDAIVNWFLDHGRLLEPDALDVILSCPEPEEAMKKVLLGIGPEEIFITKSVVRRSLNLDISPERRSETRESVMEILRDGPGELIPQGTLDGFHDLFMDRYRKLSMLLRKRQEMTGITPVSELKGGTVRIIGMVTEVRESRKGNRIAILEDPTGSIPVLMNSMDIKLVRDEVIGVEGRYLPERRLVVATSVVRPEVEYRKVEGRMTSAVVAMISDLHVGSRNFLEDEWSALVDFFRGGGPYGHLSSRVRYLLVAGDLVDGIGIYPGQFDDLDIADIHEQYNRLGELLRMIPDRINVILQVGNHDAVGPTEPQAPLGEDLTENFPANVRCVGNPAYIQIDGTRILMYHGRSIDDLVNTHPDVTYARPVEAMKLMLSMRHLAPIYGGKTPISPLSEDRLVIDVVPDVFLSGHVHSHGVDVYRGTLLVSGSTWQSQTDYQRLMNFSPRPARLTLLDLNAMKPAVLNFMDVM